MERVGAVTLRGNPFTLLGPELKPGDPAPNFEAIDKTLATVTLGPGGTVRIFSVVPSLDTPVCDAQTKRFNDELAKMEGLEIYTVSMDLPFAQSRWCTAMGVDRLKMVSDHRTGSFGMAYGTLIKELRIESRAIFVVDRDNRILHAEYVQDVGDSPDFEAAFRVAQAALAQ